MHYGIRDGCFGHCQPPAAHLVTQDPRGVFITSPPLLPRGKSVQKSRDQYHYQIFNLHYPQKGASLRAQLVQNPPAMQETLVRFLGHEDLEMATHCSLLAWTISWTEERGGLHTVHGVAQSRTGLSDFTSTFIHRRKLKLPEVK